VNPADAPIPIETLGRYLAAQIGGFGALLSVRKFDGGQSNPTYLLTTKSGRYVLRCKPAGTLLKSAHAIDREYRVLEALASSEVPVPKARHFCADANVIGTVFYVMDFVDGRVFWDPQLPEVDAETRRRIYDEMNRVLVALHRVDFTTRGLLEFGRQGGYFDRQIRRWTEQYRATETVARPDVERLIEWLPAHQPADDGRVSLVHGDFRLDNMLFDGSGRVVAVLDWELSTLGHPCADLAYQCAQWRLPTGPMRGLKGIDRSALNIPTEAAYVARYCQRMELTEIRNWEFCLVLSLFRLASICQGVYRRGMDGNASNATALEFGERTRVIAAAAVEILA
jgi:aminoglycoside phosphotransferase (APT) family kinase protein